VNSLRGPAIGLVLFNVLIATVPMLAFSPRLLALRKNALLSWGALLSRHGRLVERRWTHREELEDDALLSAPELGPVADTVSLYEAVRKMRAAPIARTSLMTPLVASVIPMIPVVATQVPLKQIVPMLFKGPVGV
jgi:hypothetical protein